MGQPGPGLQPESTASDSEWAQAAGQEAANGGPLTATGSGPGLAWPRLAVTVLAAPRLRTSPAMAATLTASPPFKNFEAAPGTNPGGSTTARLPAPGTKHRPLKNKVPAVCRQRRQLSLEAPFQPLQWPCAL